MGLRTCISKKLLGVADAAGLKTTVLKPQAYNNKMGFPASYPLCCVTNTQMEGLVQGKIRRVENYWLYQVFSNSDVPKNHLGNVLNVQTITSIPRWDSI